ncbi:MAG: hypothetical protein WBG90_10340 [Saonia sp.]
MSYKAKSLVYLVSFIAAALVYYHVEQQREVETNTTELVEANISELSSVGIE